MSSFSAPRGVIFPSRLSDFEAVSGEQEAILTSIPAQSSDALNEDLINVKHAPLASL